jgi:hypothetical protein
MNLALVCKMAKEDIVLQATVAVPETPHTPGYNSLHV